MGKIYRFPLPKYLSKLDPSDRSGTYILGIGMIAGSALLSSYGVSLAMGIVWAIGILFVVGLFWESYPKSVRALTNLVGWSGLAAVAVSVAVTLFHILVDPLDGEETRAVLAFSSLGSACFGAWFFLDVVRGAQASMRT